jgi:hypothetical protein
MLHWKRRGECAVRPHGPAARYKQRRRVPCTPWRRPTSNERSNRRCLAAAAWSSCSGSGSGSSAGGGGGAAVGRGGVGGVAKPGTGGGRAREGATNPLTGRASACDEGRTKKVSVACGPRRASSRAVACAQRARRGGGRAVVTVAHLGGDHGLALPPLCLRGGQRLTVGQRGLQRGGLPARPVSTSPPCDER